MSSFSWLSLRWLTNKKGNKARCFNLLVYHDDYPQLEYKQYSGDLKSELFEGLISNGLRFNKWSGFCYVYSSNHLKTWNFCLDIKQFWQNGGHLSAFQMVGLPDFRFHLKSRPSATQPLFDQNNNQLITYFLPVCYLLRIQQYPVNTTYNKWFSVQTITWIPEWKSGHERLKQRKWTD